MSSVSVRYIVHDVDAAIAFYRDHLGFREIMHPAPPFAMLSRGDLRLLLSASSNMGGGGQGMPDGRNDIVNGVGGRQILLDDPSGNPVELFEPAGNR